MAGVNKVILLGKLGADPEVQSLQSGMKVAKFNIATSEAYNNKEGVRVEQTEWHKIELWDKLAEIAEKYLKKGNSVYIEGKIKSEKYTDKDGIERTVIKIRGTAINLIGGASNDSNAQSVAHAPSPDPSVADLSSNDDSLPF
jgi:single-strand DNA-binding protein